MNRISLCLATATLATATAAFAGTTESSALDQKIDSTFESLDTNADGTLDSTEASQHQSLGSAFPRLATDGRLGREQFGKWYRSYDMEPAQE